MEEIKTQAQVNWQMRLGIIALFSALLTMGYKYVDSMDKIIENKNIELKESREREEILVKMVITKAYTEGQDSVINSITKK